LTLNMTQCNQKYTISGNRDSNQTPSAFWFTVIYLQKLLKNPLLKILLPISQ